MKKTVFLLTGLLCLTFAAMALPGDPLEDPRDGNTYRTVEIGDQLWMQENLAFAPEDGNYWVYADDPENAGIYGYLYDYETAAEVCPPGWRLPSADDMSALADYVTSDGADIHDALIEGGSSGFEASMGGFVRSASGSFFGMGEAGYWITSTTCESDYHVFHLMVNDSAPFLTQVAGENILKEDGLSVRCMKEM